MRDIATEIGSPAMPVSPTASQKREAAAHRGFFVRANEWALGTILAIMAVLQFTNVVVRYCTDDSVAWAEEVSRHLMIWLVFLGLGSAFRIGLHMAIDNLHQAVPAAIARAVRAGIIVLLAATCVILAYQGWVYMARSGMQTTPVTQVPFSYVYAALPVGFALMLLHVLAVAPRFIRSGAYDVSEDVAPADANAL